MRKYILINESFLLDVNSIEFLYGRRKSDKLYEIIIGTRIEYFHFTYKNVEEFEFILNSILDLCEICHIIKSKSCDTRLKNEIRKPLNVTNWVNDRVPKDDDKNG